VPGSAMQRRHRLISLFRRGPRGSAARAVSAAAVAATSAALLAAGATGTASAATAGGAGHPAFWVAASGSSANSDTSCQSAGYSTVQSAVTAAQNSETGPHSPVPTIEVCPGTYQEQVTITKSLNITHAPFPGGLAEILLPASPALSTTNCQVKDTSGEDPQSVVEICAAAAGGTNTSGVQVSLNGVTVKGDWPGNVCNDSLYGILVEGGATLNLTASTVQNIGADPTTSAGGCQGGVGVDAGNSYTNQIGHAYLSGDKILTYQKNGIVIDGAGSLGKIVNTVVTGAGPTPYIAQNGIQISTGATGSVTHSSISGNNYTGTGEASSTGILVYGGGSSCSGGDPQSGLVQHASFTDNTLDNNDVGIALFNIDPTCAKSAATPTRDVACYNVISNDHGYPNGVASADANISGLVTSTGYVGDQAGVSDTGNRDVICGNRISGAGYQPRDATSSLPNPPPPAWVRPVDIFSYAAAIDPQVTGNRYDGQPYHP
jgi:hypothetical protein